MHFGNKTTAFSKHNLNWHKEPLIKDFGEKDFAPEKAQYIGYMGEDFRDYLLENIGDVQNKPEGVSESYWENLIKSGIWDFSKWEDNMKILEDLFIPYPFLIDKQKNGEVRSCSNAYIQKLFNHSPGYSWGKPW